MSRMGVVDGLYAAMFKMNNYSMCRNKQNKACLTKESDPLNTTQLNQNVVLQNELKL